MKDAYHMHSPYGKTNINAKTVLQCGDLCFTKYWPFLFSLRHSSLKLKRKDSLNIKADPKLFLHTRYCVHMQEH